MKNLKYILFSIILLAFVNCTNRDGESPAYKLIQINYEDFNRIIGSANGGISQIYDTITGDRNTKLQDTVKLYLPANIVTQFDANNISFEFLDNNMIKYVDFDDAKQIISQKYQSEDSIYVIKKDGVDIPVFVCVNSGKQYYRTLSAFRFQSNGIDSVALVKDTILNTNILLSKFNLTSIDKLNKNDTLSWVNVYYIYQ